MKKTELVPSHAVRTYGSNVSTKQVSSLCWEPVHTPQINKNYIQANAVSRGPVAEADVREYHSRLFLEANAQLRQACYRLITTVGHNIAGLDRQIQEVSEIAESTKRYKDSFGGGLPWTLFSKLQVIVLALFSVLMILIGLNTVATVLMSAGNPVWNTWWRCYLFSAVPVGLAFGLKIYKGWIEDPAKAMHYCRVITVLGLLFGTIWAAMFGSMFQGLTQSTAEILSDITNPTSHKTSTLFQAVYTVVTFLAESTIAASCWLSIENTMHKHQPNTRQPNEARSAAQNDLNQLVSVKASEETMRAQLEGKLDAMEHSRKRYVEEAVAVYWDIAKHFKS